MNFGECSKFQANPKDLLLLKKHSKTNSVLEDHRLEIDGKNFDLNKLENLFES